MGDKYYSVNGKTLHFTDIHIEAGCLYGKCVTYPFCDKWAWLDPNGFQFEGRRRTEAREMNISVTSGIPYGCHYWGGELRNNAEWRKQW